MKSAKVRELESKLTLSVGEDEPDVFSEDGTDLTQVRMMLSMTPTERLSYIQSLAQSVVRMRRELKHPA